MRMIRMLAVATLALTLPLLPACERGGEFDVKQIREDVARSFEVIEDESEQAAKKVAEEVEDARQDVRDEIEDRS